MPAVAVLLTSSNYCYQFYIQVDQFALQAKSIQMKAMKLCLGWISRLNPDCSAVGKLCLFALHIGLVSLSQTMQLDPARFLMEEGRKDLSHCWGRILWTPENPGEKIWWKGRDCCWGNHYLTGESRVGVHLLVLLGMWKWDRNVQLCGGLGQLRCIMIADDSNCIFLADKTVPDCWLSVQTQCLVWLSIL